MKTLITGVDSGLGKELFQRFQSGTRESHTLGTTIANVPKDHPTLLPLHVEEDHGASASLALEGIDDAVCERVGPNLDILINNAGVNCICPFEDLSEEAFLYTMRVNCILPWRLTQFLLDMLSPGGRVINVVSEASWKPMRHSLAYNCSKAAARMATLQMARELTRPHNVSIIAVHPGKILDTGMTCYIDEQIKKVRGFTDDESRAYQAAGRVCQNEHTPQALADIIFKIATSDHFPTMSGAMLDLVG